MVRYAQEVGISETAKGVWDHSEDGKVVVVSFSLGLE